MTITFPNVSLHSRRRLGRVDARLAGVPPALVEVLWEAIGAWCRCGLSLRRSCARSSSADPPTALLFPSFITEREAMLTDWRKTLDRIAGWAGWQGGEVRTKAFRHSYCAARLQTMDSGAPVSPFTVSRELGHGSRVMVEEVYAHLGAMRHRTEVVEYRIEQHRILLGQWLSALES